MPINRLVFLAALVAVGIVLYLTTAVQGDWGFVLLLRGKKLLAMLLVGSAIASATVVFQTLTANRILTPSIIGLDALYLLSKMVVIYFLGSAAQLAPAKRSATTSRGTKTAVTLTPNTSHNNNGSKNRRGLTRIRHQLTISPAVTAISSSNPLNRITEPMATSMGRRVA